MIQYRTSAITYEFIKTDLPLTYHSNHDNYLLYSQLIFSQEDPCLFSTFPSEEDPEYEVL